MKSLFWLMLFAGCAPALSQVPDPVYGLGVCTSGTYHTQPEEAPTTGPGAWCVPTAGDSSLHGFLRHFEEGLTGFVNGDPAGWLQHVSAGDDVTILGGWGAYERGRQPVGARYGWAAARFLPGGARVAVEYLSIGQSGGLAYTVSIERSRVRPAGREGVVPLALRVTHVFRREAGTWKLLHRHADPLLHKTAPAAVREKSPLRVKR